MYFAAGRGYLADQDRALVSFTYATDVSKKPSQIDLHIDENLFRGIFELDGDDLKMILADGERSDRPLSFNSAGDRSLMLLVMKRDPSHRELSPEVVEAQSKEAKAIAKVSNDLKVIGLALHNYADLNKTLPPAAILGQDGKPLLSWRVAILPWLEQNTLHKQFNLNEPWDSEHNKKLLASMPRYYGAEGTETHYRVFTGKGTAFEGSKGLK